MSKLVFEGKLGALTQFHSQFEGKLEGLVTNPMPVLKGS